MKTESSMNNRSQTSEYHLLLQRAHDLLHNLAAVFVPGNDTASSQTTSLMAEIRAALASPEQRRASKPGTLDDYFAAVRPMVPNPKQNWKVAPNDPPWYCVGPGDHTTLCRDQAEAQNLAIYYTDKWSPKEPYRAVQLVEIIEIAAERERCARLCEQMGARGGLAERNITHDCAEAIRGSHLGDTA